MDESNKTFRYKYEKSRNQRRAGALKYKNIAREKQWLIRIVAYFSHDINIINKRNLIWIKSWRREPTHTRTVTPKLSFLNRNSYKIQRPFNVNERHAFERKQNNTTNNKSVPLGIKRPLAKDKKCCISASRVFLNQETICSSSCKLFEILLVIVRLSPS